MKRRDVLKTGVIAASGLMLPMISGALAAEGEARELKLGLIGVGTQGRELIRAALMDQKVRFTAIADIWQYARRYGEYYLKSCGHEVRSYADYEEMLAKQPELDAVLVASPDLVHAQQTAACLKAGKHVYCETPMSSSLEGARSMVRAMRESGKLLQVGFQRRSNPRYLHVCEKLLAEAKLIGRTAQANTSWAIALKPDRGFPRRQEMPADQLAQHGYPGMQELRNWRWYRKYSGGLFANLGSHQVDVVCWFLGAAPHSVMASGQPPADASLWEGNVVALYQFDTSEGVVQASCQMLTATRGDGSGSYESLLGDEGSIRISQNPKFTAVHRDPDAPDWDEWVRRGYLTQGEKERLRPAERQQAEVAETGQVVPYEIPVVLDTPPVYPHLANFFDAVRGRARLNCPGDVAMITEAAVHKVNEALRSGQRTAFQAEEFVV